MTNQYIPAEVRELLERTAEHLEWDGSEPMTTIQYAYKCDGLAADLRALLAQPQQEGVDQVEVVGYKLLKSRQLCIVAANKVDDIPLMTVPQHHRITEQLHIEIHQLQREGRLNVSEIESLKRIAERAQSYLLPLQAERDQLQARVVELEKDAARWRFLCDVGDAGDHDLVLARMYTDGEHQELRNEVADYNGAIDAAMKEYTE